MLYRCGKLCEAVGDREPGRLRAHVDVVERPGPRIIIQGASVDNDEVGPTVVAPAEAGAARVAEHPRAAPPSPRRACRCDRQSREPPDGASVIACRGK